MADETTKFESCQALFCAFADLIGRADSKKLFFEKGKFPGELTFETYDDFINSNKIGTRKVNIKQLLKQAYQEIDTNQAMSFSACENFLRGTSSWFKSSVILAVKLINDLHTKSAGGISLSKFKNIGATGMQKIDYYRGDRDVMGNIEKIVRICMKNTVTTAAVIKNMKAIPFKDPNKWSPADIYYATDKAKKQIADFLKEAEDPNYEPTHYFHLNEMVHDLMVSGDLLGVSLKKQDKPDSAKIELVNFDNAIKKELLNKISYIGHNVPGSQKAFKNVVKGGKAGKIKIGKRNIKWPAGEVPTMNVIKNMPGRDFVVECKVGDSKTGHIQMRHDPSNNGWKVDFKYKGSGARAGSVTSLEIFCNIWKLVDKEAGAKMLSKGNRARTKYTSEVKKFMADKKQMMKLQQIPFKTVGTAGKWMEDGKSKWYRFKSSAYDFQKGELSATIFMNAVLPVLTSWFNADGDAAKSQKDAFCRLIYQYVTSRHPESGKFIIAK